MTKSSERPTYNSTEVAKMFDINRMTLDRWLKDEKIPRPKKDPKSKTYIWTQSDLDNVAKYIKESSR
jgi:predicted site-specific integrase-resolvase